MSRVPKMAKTGIRNQKAGVRRSLYIVRILDCGPPEPDRFENGFSYVAVIENLRD